ncbi:MAG: phosphoribosylaminoimidazolesuccinocarboxamide synthase [Thermodesulfovibrio sp.]|nr:phosphoribosylaminoimidazolesuccinocarboxamide synthase [Thermodesulfovibrio sp.]
MEEKVVLKTNLEGVKFLRSGKVRDIYEIDDYLLIVATDRVSAFDVVLPNGIPGKGKVLTQISLFWFNQVKDLVENHIVSANVDEFPQPLRKYKDILEGRSMLVKKAKPLPVECIVRGYITGSGWKDYQKTGSVCGIKLPEGLLESQKLPEPIYTPSTKAEKGHDINISFEETIKILGKETANKVKDLTISIYKRASEIAEKKGIIIADTKMEFGFYNGKLILIDELLTPDSSRFWSMKDYKPGKSQDSYDKQIVRDYLISIKWDKKPPAPVLPDEIVQKTAERYDEIFRILTS